MKELREEETIIEDKPQCSKLLPLILLANEWTKWLAQADNTIGEFTVQLVCNDNTLQKMVEDFGQGKLGSM